MTTVNHAKTLHQELEETRAAYHALLAEIPDDAWERPSANPAWNIREMMTHIILAPKMLPLDIKMIRQKRWVTPPAALFNWLNVPYTRFVARGQTRQSLAEQYDAAHTAVLALLDSIREDEWELAEPYPNINENLSGSQSIADMFHYLTLHFHEHVADVRQGLAAQEQGMPTVKPPTGLGKLAFRAPIYLFRAGLGGLMGNRFLLLNHIGRKSGQLRQAVLEVVHYERETDTYFVASGYGRSSQWFRNIQANPEVTIQVGSRKLAVTATILGPEESGDMMVQYAHRYPNAAKNLSRLIGYQVDGSDASYRQVGADHIPFIAMRPRLVLEEGHGPWPLLALTGTAVALGLLLRKKRHDD
ncbi:MAG: nitroreductase family deazaflavin-dependent oxidoreductase [Ardenticatenaceae bacterium]|nr:nitroreductase family deazaflavin-dependent oxidoreductase [Ardenticatenaceae bacterium]